MSGFSLAGGDVATKYLGNFGDSEAKRVTWHVQYPCTVLSPWTSEVTAADAEPGTVPSSDVLTTRSGIPAIAGGQILASDVPDGSRALGQISFHEVTYEFGSISTGDVIHFQPAGNADFDAGCHELVGATVLSSELDAVPEASVSELVFQAASSQAGSGNQVVMRYEYRTLCSTGTGTNVLPLAATHAAGFNYKYSGNYGSVESTPADQSFPAPHNPLSMTVVSEPASADPGEEVVVRAFLSAPDPTNTWIDSFHVTLPPGAVYGGLIEHPDCVLPGSSVGQGNSAELPAVGSTGTLDFIAHPSHFGSAQTSYARTPVGPLGLCFRMTLAGDGPWTTTVQAKVGTTDAGTDSVEIANAPPPLSKCTSKQLRAIAKISSSFAKCHATAVKAGEAPESECFTKASDKLASAWAKLYDGDCLTEAELAAVQASVDQFDGAASSDLPALLQTGPGPSLCTSAKLRAAGKNAAGQLKCHSKAIKKGVDPSQQCIAKAADKLVAAWIKADSGPDCQMSGELGAATHLIGETIADLLDIVAP